MKIPNGYRILILVCCLVVTFKACLAFVTYFGIPTDWTTYRLAARALVEGRSPYVLDNDCQFYNPPWALLPLIPFAYLPPPLDSLCIVALGLVGVVGFCAYIGMTIKSSIVWLLTPPVIGCVLVGQIDWMVLYGFFCPPVLAFFLLMIKPQVGLGVAVFRFVMLWREGGFWFAMGKAAPALIALLLSFVVYGFWPLNALAMAEQEVHWFTTIWPQAIPVGFALMYLALTRQNMRYAMGAAPCLSNHVIPSSWMGALVTLSDKPGLLAVVSVSMWAVMILHAFSIL